MTAELDPISIRPGRATDGEDILSLWDVAIAWMVERGQPEQWGTEPASARPRTRGLVESWLEEPGLRIAEIGGEPVGASVTLARPPAHVPTTPLRETYLNFLISHRAHAGKDIGGKLVRLAAADARAAGSEVLRVDCWAGAPALVAWYERQGFIRSDTFTVDVRGPWHGQVFEMPLS
jgi:GNAT superfamily N-acetyltransferase